jgi:hypothetical protein
VVSEEEFARATQTVDVAQCPSDQICPSSSPPPSLQLSTYDVLFVVATPFDSLDLLASNFVDRFPSIMVDGKDRLQKRMLYMLGVNMGGMVRHCQSQVTRLRSLGVSNLSALELVSNDFRLSMSRTYDVILHRSPFEVNLLRRAGVELNDLRLQHVFGVGEHDPTTLMASARIDSVFVCFMAFHPLCTASEREKAAMQHRVIDERGDDPVSVLLLVGGLWEDWLACENVVRLEDTDRVAHVSEGQWSGEAVTLIQRARRVFFMHGGDVDRDQDGDLMRCLESEDNLSSWCSSETLSTSLWPLVAAAVSADGSDGLRGRIHLATSNALLLSSVTTDGASGWSAASLDREVRHALDRLHGFGSTRSNLTVDVLKIRRVDVDQEVVVCDNCSEDEDALLLQSNYLTHSSANVDSDGSPVLWVLLRLNCGASFEVGRDGEACMQRTQRGEDRVCLLRPFRYIKLVVHRGNVVGRLTTVDMTFSLRGTFYADIFFSQRLEINLTNAQPHGKSAAVLNDVSILDDIFVYNVYL